MKYIQIDGVVGNIDNDTAKKWLDLFIEWVEANGWEFMGVPTEPEDDNED